MKYTKLFEGIFLKRPNRFLAHVILDGKEEVIHVKNTGRLRELLIPGVRVLVEPASSPKRKTKFSLICVEKDGQWVNIDSQVVNTIAAEWIQEGHLFSDVRFIKREQKYGNSRFDLYVETEKDSWFIEVKGVTLEMNGVALFPDAPTERGVKHVEELIKCRKEGYKTGILFVVQRKGITHFEPHKERHPEFAEALRNAKLNDVSIMAVDCIVDEEGIRIDERIPVEL